jgi:hypothetical protein
MSAQRRAFTQSGPFPQRLYCLPYRLVLIVHLAFARYFIFDAPGIPLNLGFNAWAVQKD